jgi:hypothetical protein
MCDVFFTFGLVDSFEVLLSDGEGGAGKVSAGRFKGAVPAVLLEAIALELFEDDVPAFFSLARNRWGREDASLELRLN